MEIFVLWKIVLEILILWYAIYMMLLFFKGTRSEQLLKGLLIIGVIFVVAQQLGLTAINWLLTRLFPISVIALVIIFQPELRRGLARLGQIGSHQENLEAVDEIADAAATLSKYKIGALIAIERETGLKSYMETGVQLDAKVTGSLLISIFLHQSPLHDGAVILQSGRIAAAACVLPLTQEDKDLPKSMGMRHRAAIGITDETDAVCVVVSEETGTISITHNGKMTRGLDEESLKRHLKGFFYKQHRKGGIHVSSRFTIKGSGENRD